MLYDVRILRIYSLRQHSYQQVAWQVDFVDKDSCGHMSSSCWAKQSAKFRITYRIPARLTRVVSHPWHGVANNVIHESLPRGGKACASSVGLFRNTEACQGPCVENKTCRARQRVHYARELQWVAVPWPQQVPSGAQTTDAMQREVLISLAKCRIPRQLSTTSEP